MSSLIHFANSFETDQAQQNIVLNPDKKMVFLNDFFKNVNLKNSLDDKKHEKLPSM